MEPKQQPGVIYEIPCLHCVGIYIGEPGRTFRTRCKEHMHDVNPKNLARLENNTNEQQIFSGETCIFGKSSYGLE